MAKVHDHCKGKMICDSSEPTGPDNTPHENVPEGLQKIGCGHVQPLIRKEALKLFMVYKKTKDDDEQVGPG
jgi:DNA-directed RNA polymerase II subunit RPB1